MRNTVLKIALLLSLYWVTEQPIYGTSNGPKIIDIIGYDNQRGLVYFAHTWWAECDCETDLYIYHLDGDSLEIHEDWANRYTYHFGRNEVISSMGLGNLEPIDTIQNPILQYSFSWLQDVDYYSPVIMKDTINCPFQITLGKNDYQFTQCYSRDKEPTITFHEVTPEIGLVHIRFVGECFEQNTVDKVILYKLINTKLLSLELFIDKQLLL